MNGPFIDVAGLTKSYETATGPLVVLRGVDLELGGGRGQALVHDELVE